MSNTTASPAKILIVDDEPNIIIAIEFLLQRAGFEVFKAFSGIQALELASECLPQLVILDVMMPGLSGFEVAAQLRQNPVFENLKIVFLTAKGTETDKETGYAKGAEYYLVKPFDNDHLVSTVQEIISYG